MSPKSKSKPKPKPTIASHPTSANSARSDEIHVIHWHRTDLRLHDSPSLNAALALNPTTLVPLWTWDPHYVYHARVGPNRWKFLTDCQRDLSASYTRLNPKQILHVVREAPQTVFPKLFKAWGTTHLVFEADTDAYAKERDAEITRIARECDIEVISVPGGRTLFDPDDLVRRNGGKPTMSMAQVRKAVGKDLPARPLSTPTTLPDPPTRMDLSGVEHHPPEAEADLNAAHRDNGDGKAQYSDITGPNGDFGVPTLEEMGIDPATATTPHRGGESVALAMLAGYCANAEYVSTFEKPKTAPSAFEPQSTTLLSPHLHFGSLSVRKFWWDVADVIEQREKAKKPVSDIPVNLPGQLLFRDMYFGAQAALGYSFAQTQGNKIARFVPWHLQSNYATTPSGEHLLDGTYSIDSPEAEVWFRRWKSGTTGFPWIDALMRQLKQEGWIHHLGRHSVASFLTRGGCYVHWERGAEVFEEWLLDHETACNVGNWMWLSCTAFFSQFYRVYSPVAFPKKWDPEGTFVRRYVPELANYDKKYIYEPHLAPIADQKAWGCVVRGDGAELNAGAVTTYPKPMFDFNQRRQICIDGMKKAYGAGLYGDDDRVLNGNWKVVFDYIDRSAELRDETNGIVEREKKRTKFEHAAEGPRRTEVHEADQPAGTRSKTKTVGKKQSTLDAHIGKNGVRM